MKDVSAMENEELLDAYDALDWNEHQFKTSSAHVAQYNLARAELLRRLSAPVQPGPRPLDEKRLAEIRERESKAMPEPRLTSYSHGGGRLISNGENDLIADFYDLGNREFYYHARADIPYLLEQIESLRRRVPAQKFSQKWSEDAFVVLAGLKESVSWELAPEIMKEINRLVEQLLATTQGTPEGLPAELQKCKKCEKEWSKCFCFGRPAASQKGEEGK